LAYKPRTIDIEDLMQEVAVRFISKIHTLREASAFKPWLRRIAINVARESARRLKDPADRGSIVDSQPGSTPPPGDVVSTRDEACGLLAHAMTLPPEFREPLILRTVQGMGCKQIAEILELPITTIETRLTRARRMLRQEWTGIRENPSVRTAAEVVHGRTSPATK
jgi:RNA polymerase sigma-70 factor (ECF subfamily)